MKQLNLFR